MRVSNACRLASERYEDLDGCNTDCAANADTCIADCLGVPECELDCINCEANCDAAREQCRTDNKATRDLLRDGCDGLQGECGDVCVDPLNRQDVRDCTTAEHGCRDTAKRAEVGCKKDCPKDGGREACIRGCRKTNNLDQQVCEDVATMCYAAVAGLTLP
jgi:hypothetical protein